MPAVQVEPLTGLGPQEQELLARPDLAQRVGKAIAAGIRRFFSG
jgi:N-acetylmuramoyl-L-alanine amidase